MNTVQKILRAVVYAEADKSNLSGLTWQTETMSSPKVRHLLNNLARDFVSYSRPYLEIGVWKGGTLRAACIGNNGWFWGYERDERWLAEIDKIEHPGIVMEWREFTGDNNLSLIPGLIFYDGSKAAADLRKVYPALISYLQQGAVLVVDDITEREPWAENEVILRDHLQGLEPSFYLRLGSPENGNKAGWWNGLAVVGPLKTFASSPAEC